MAFADPQSVTINAVPYSMPRTGSGVGVGTFSHVDGNVTMKVSQQYGKRTRRLIRLDFSKIAADPLISAQNIRYAMSCQFIIDEPITGFTVTEAKQVADALVAYLSASTGAKITQLLGGEA